MGVGTGLGRGRLFPFGRGGTIAPANSPIASENVPEFCRGNTDAFALPYPDLFNARERRGGAWDLMSRARCRPIY